MSEKMKNQFEEYEKKHQKSGVFILFLIFFLILAVGILLVEDVPLTPQTIWGYIKYYFAKLIAFLFRIE